MRSLKSLVDDPTSSAFDLIRGVRAEIPDAIEWEPESIFEEMQDRGIDTDLDVQDKILAAVTLLLCDDFYLVPDVFENTVNAFGNRRVNVEAIQEPYPRHMAWGVEEALKIRGLGNRTLSHPEDRVCHYVAIVLYREGFIVAPKELSFSQEWLDDLNHNTALKKKVSSEWKKLTDKGSSGLMKAELSEDIIGVQLSHLAEVETYVRYRDGDEARA